MGVRTTKPISTISFNTEAFLKERLNDLVKSKKISFYSFVKHKPEDDEGGKKEHFHVYLEPSKIVQTDDLREFLKEFDPLKPDKPKGCLKFNTSKFDHWYMYALHDKRYLASKGESRRFHYIKDDFISSDEDDFDAMVYGIDWMSLSPYEDMINAQNSGLSWDDYFRFGRIPIQQIKVYYYAWNLLLSKNTERGGREGHSNIDEVFELLSEKPNAYVDCEGEVIRHDE